MSEHKFSMSMFRNASDMTSAMQIYIDAQAETIAAKGAEIARLREALKQIAGESGQFGFPWPETHVDYPAFALLTARAALKEQASE